MNDRKRAVEAWYDVDSDPIYAMRGDAPDALDYVEAVAAALGITFDADGNIDAPFFVPQWVDTGPALMLGIPEDVPIDATATYLLIRRRDD